MRDFVAESVVCCAELRRMGTDCGSAGRDSFGQPGSLVKLGACVRGAAKKEVDIAELDQGLDRLSSTSPLVFSDSIAGTRLRPARAISSSDRRNSSVPGRVAS